MSACSRLPALSYLSVFTWLTEFHSASMYASDQGLTLQGGGINDRWLGVSLSELSVNCNLNHGLWCHSVTRPLFQLNVSTVCGILWVASVNQ